MMTRRIVGRSPECDMSIDSEYLNKRHFAMERDDATGRITVEDLGTMNGTEVNNGLGWVKAYGPTPIGPGSKIFAGRVLFKIDQAGQVTVIKDVSLFDRDKA